MEMAYRERWQSEIAELRKTLSGFDLTEECKWGNTCRSWGVEPRSTRRTNSRVSPCRAKAVKRLVSVVRLAATRSRKRSFVQRRAAYPFWLESA